jgi:hypothetical protein
MFTVGLFNKHLVAKDFLTPIIERWLPRNNNITLILKGFYFLWRIRFG